MTKGFGKKTLANQVVALNRKAVCTPKVVSLEEFKSLNKKKSVRTILVVDDDQIIRNAIKRVFEGDSIRVLTAKDAMEFSRVLENEELDVILLDIGLPWVNGYELCGLLKSQPSLRDLPVAFVSGNKTEDDVRRGFEAGCDEYITKPFEVEDLKKVVNRLLAKDSPPTAV